MNRPAAVPDTWERGNIRRFAQMKSGHTPSRSVPEYWEHTNIPWFTLADVWQLRDGKQIYLGETANMINELGLAHSAAELLPAGTVVLSRTASVGFSGIMPKRMATSQDFWNWVCGPRLLPEYLNYQFKSMGAVFRSLNMGSTHQTIYQKDAASLQIVVPPLETQRAIVDFLHRETARIDTLIEEQQRLIEMLHERRLAAITDSVVDALEPNRAPRDSSWYPTLPAGWGFGRVKSIATRVTDGAHISPDTDGGVFDFVSTRDLRAGSIDFDAALKTTPETYEYMVKTGCQPRDGDVLFSKDGTVGETAVIRGEHPFVVASSLVIISPDPTRMESEYLAYVFASKTAREQAASMMRGAGLPRLSVGNLGRVELPIPPLDEQRRITAFLDEQTAKTDTLIAESRRFIALSFERRAALISAAVTGQIEVPEVA